MAAFILAGLLAATLICVLVSGVLLPAGQKRKNSRTLLARASRLGTANNLSFSSREVWGDRVIGLDGINRKLATLVRQDAHTYDSALIDLNEVAGGSVNKEYGNGHDQPEKIFLRFAFTDGRAPVDITFFESSRNDPQKRAQWDRKAAQWSAILSKMLLPPPPSPRQPCIFPREPAKDPERSPTFMDH